MEALGIHRFVGRGRLCSCCLLPPCHYRSFACGSIHIEAGVCPLPLCCNALSCSWPYPGQAGKESDGHPSIARLREDTMITQPIWSSNVPKSSAASITRMSLDSIQSGSLHGACGWMPYQPRPVLARKVLQASLKLCKGTHNGSATMAVGRMGSSRGWSVPHCSPHDSLCSTASLQAPIGDIGAFWSAVHLKMSV